jgi:phage tail tape-measure protein
MSYEDSAVKGFARSAGLKTEEDIANTKLDAQAKQAKDAMTSQSVGTGAAVGGIAGGMVGGAMAGAEVGSIVPGIGTAIGAVVGAGLGLAFSKMF